MYLNRLTLLSCLLLPLGLAGKLGWGWWTPGAIALAWHGDFLIILSQYPDRLGNNLFALPKAEIIDSLEGQRQEPIQPQPIALKGIEESYKIKGFEGFDAIAFSNNQAFITIEAETHESAKGYLITGTLADDLSELVITPNKQAEILPQSASKNKAEEAIFTIPLLSNRLLP